MKSLINILEAHVNDYGHLLENQKENQKDLGVSIVIPVFNSEETLEFSIKSIASQTDISKIKDVIIVDDNSTDRSLSVARNLAIKYKDKLKIIIEHNKSRQYSGYCRNKGLKLSKSEVIIFIDSDIILPPTYVQEHLSIHKKVSNCIVFSLRSDTAIDKTDMLTFPVRKFNNEFRYEILEKNNYLEKTKFIIQKDFTLPEICLTCSVSYKRKDLVLVKGCPENFKGWGYNDTAMAAKVIALGRKVIPAINASVYHFEHKPRSGSKYKKDSEYMLNKIRYEKMIQMPYRDTFKYKIQELEI